MAVTLAIRLDSAKKAEIAAISQMSSSLKPWLAIWINPLPKSCAPRLLPHREVEHGSLRA